AIIHATVAHSEGRRASLSECLDATASVFVPLVGLSLLYLLGLIVGFVFLIVPGLMAWCVWFVAKPAFIIEREGVLRAFGRSKELTAFEGWKMFGILLILLMTGAAVSELARIVARAIEGTDPVATFSVSYRLLLAPVTTLSY